MGILTSNVLDGELLEIEFVVEPIVVIEAQQLPFAVASCPAQSCPLRSVSHTLLIDDGVGWWCDDDDVVVVDDDLISVCDCMPPC